MIHIFSSKFTHRGTLRKQQYIKGYEDNMRYEAKRQAKIDITKYLKQEQQHYKIKSFIRKPGYCAGKKFEKELRLAKIERIEIEKKYNLVEIWN